MNSRREKQVCFGACSCRNATILMTEKIEKYRFPVV